MQATKLDIAKTDEFLMIPVMALPYGRKLRPFRMVVGMLGRVILRTDVH